MKQYEITVIRNGREQKVTGNVGESLLAVLSEHEIYISAACGGKGRCGKCGVFMCEGVTEITDADRQFFSEDQLNQGMRLACMSYPRQDCRVDIEVGDEADFEVVTEYQDENHNGIHGTVPYTEINPGRDTTEGSEKGSFNIAIDIGTTTIAVSLVCCEKQEILDTVTLVNHQRAYGADVISRIQAANEGKLAELSHSIRKDLYESMVRLLEETGKGFSQIGRIVIAGNTTMGHLLMGFPCETLGVYPFDPVDISMIRTDFSELFWAVMKEADEHGDSKTNIISQEFEEKIKPVTITEIDEKGAIYANIEVILLPGISTYVGADIVSGLLSCGFDRSDEVNILIDLGTNGEMAIGNKDCILVTSTAAGPAFEGGNISCGMGSVKGAICQVEISGTEVNCETIGGKAPVGLCGTGVIETTYELLKEAWIDETGMLDEDYFDDGFPLAKTPDGQEISFSQKDVREIQLAKSAVRAGLETLLLRYGVTYDEVGHVYLAGGFGFKLDLKKAAGIGLLPEELLDRTVAVGNSSLEGCVEFITEPADEERINAILHVSEEIPLASDKDFNRFYTDYMFFE